MKQVTNKDDNSVWTRCKQLDNSNAYTHFYRLHGSDIVNFPVTVDEGLDDSLLTENSLVFTNQTISMMDFYFYWNEFAIKRMQQVKHAYPNGLCFGQRTDIMIDKKYNQTQIVDLCQHILDEKYDSLPAYVFKYQKGKGTYLAFYICNRHFYGEEIDEPVLYSRDVYRDKTNGRLTNKDNPNAIKQYKKGEVKYTITTRFSLDSHEKLFPTDYAMNSKTKFNQARKEMDNYTIDLFDALGSTVKENNVTLPHVSFDSQIRKYAESSPKPILKKDYLEMNTWHYFIKGKMSEYLNRYIPTILEMYPKWYDEEQYNAVWNDFRIIINTMTQHIRELKFKYGPSNHKQRYKINYKKHGLAAQEIRQAFHDLLEQKIKPFIKKWIADDSWSYCA